MNQVVFLDSHTVLTKDNSPKLSSHWQCHAFNHTTLPADIIQASLSADVIFTNKVALTADMLKVILASRNHERPLWVMAVASGYDHVKDCLAFENVELGCVPGYAVEAVAQWAISWLLADAMQITRASQASIKTTWPTANQFCGDYPPRKNLSDIQLGLVGYGAIARQLEQYAHLFGIQTYLAASPNHPESSTRHSLSSLVTHCDYISLHCPLTTNTHHLVDSELLAKAHPALVILNAGRGALVDEEAMATALAAKQLRGYITDVLAQEPPHTNHPLFTSPNCWVTPHIGWKNPKSIEHLLTALVQVTDAAMTGNPFPEKYRVKK